MAAEAGGTGTAPPVLSGLTSNPSSVTVTEGKPLTIQAVGNDPDGDTLAYNWTATGGTLNTTAGQLVYWIPPSTAGTYAVSVVVTDSRGASTSGSVNVVVSPQGTAVVSPGTPAPTPSATPSATPVSQYVVNAQTNVFVWDWRRFAVDVRGFGDTTVTCDALNAPYDAVIIEYESLVSRQIAIVRRGQAVDLDLRGAAWVYCIGSAPATGSVTFVARGRRLTVPVRQVSEFNTGLRIDAPTNVRLKVRGGNALNDARNKTRFFHMIAVSVSPTAIRYKVLRPGDRVPHSQGTTNVFVGFTDTSDGLGDNAGNWSIEGLPDGDADDE